MKTTEKEYRTKEQFESIADDCLNGNWNDAAKDCVEHGFFANDLIRFNQTYELFYDAYDIALLVEIAQKLRN